MYAKIVKEGNCEQRLSPEEEQVLRDVVLSASSRRIKGNGRKDI